MPESICVVWFVCKYASESVLAYWHTSTLSMRTCILCVLVCQYASTHSMQVRIVCVLAYYVVYILITQGLTRFNQTHQSLFINSHRCIWACACTLLYLGACKLVSMLTCTFVLLYSSITTIIITGVCLCVCVYLSVCVHLSQQVTCRCSLFNLAGLGENQVTSQTLFSQHTSHSKKRTHHDANSSWRKMTLLWGVSAIFCHLNQWQFESVPSIKNLFCSCNGGSWFFSHNVL